MKKRYFYLPGFVLLLFSELLSAQGLVSVNNFTGTASIGIPLYTVTSGPLSAPVSAYYNAGGLKVKDVEGNAGMGWNVSVGGSITRTVRDLPDDQEVDDSGHDRKGWLHNTNAAKIASFGIVNTGAPNCSNEASDATYISSNFSDLSDTEPDIFSLSAPGLSCQLYIDASHTFRTMPYRDLKITCNTDAFGHITDFTVINDRGITYTFSSTDLDTKTVEPTTPAHTYNQREQDLYKYGVTFTTAWKLTSMTDMQDNTIIFSYGANVTQRVTPVKLSLAGSGTVTTQYNIKERIWISSLSSISTGSNRDIVSIAVDFVYDNYARTGTVIKSIQGYGKTTSFNYTYATARSSFTYGREFLTGIDVGDQQFNFRYHGINFSSFAPVISLPDSSSKAIDYWGYYNGSSNTSLIPQLYINPSDTTYERYKNNYPTAHTSPYLYTVSGVNRNANVDSAQIGTIDTIKYSRGGYTTLKYESNDFWDPTAGERIYGGGLRIKQIKDWDGISSTAASEQNYSYTDPATGINSGKPISIPVFEFTVPSTTGSTDLDKWKNSTYFSEDDLSTDDKTIIYSYVTVSQPNAGSTRFHYATPATNWDKSYSTDWVRTRVYLARPTCTTLTYATSSPNTFPFPNNANYDFERGLLMDAVSFKGTDIVSQTTYTYARLGSVNTTTGFKFAYNGSLVAYAKYNIYSDFDVVPTVVTSKVYDLNSTSLYKQSTVNSYYTSTKHRLLTSQEATGSDGSINRTKYKYLKDYNAATHSDSATVAIYNLQQANCNYPVETTQEVERSSTVKTVAAGLVKFKRFNLPGGSYLNGYLPSQKLKFVSGPGVTDFSPATITAGAFVNDSRYIVTENDLTYDETGFLQTADDNNKNVTTIITNANAVQPAAVVSNASFNELAYGTGGAYAKPVDKNPFSDQYYFSASIIAPVSGTLTITLAGNSHTHTYPFAYTASGTGKYYVFKVPIATDLGDHFTFSYSTDHTADIYQYLFYPGVAQAATYSYYGSRQKASETNTNGKTVYYDYDFYQRLKHVYDNDHNIVQSRSYVTRSGNDTTTLGSIRLAASTLEKDATFSLDIPVSLDQEGMNFAWQFGDGTSLTTASSSFLVHTYPSFAAYSMQLTITSPFYPTRTITKTVTTTHVVPPHFTTVNAAGMGDGSGTILGLSFYSGTTLVLYFNQAQIEAGNMSVPAGTYTIKVAVEGWAYNAGTGTGYNRITADMDATAECQAYSGRHATYSFFEDLSAVDNLLFGLDLGSCP